MLVTPTDATLALFAPSGRFAQGVTDCANGWLGAHVKTPALFGASLDVRETLWTAEREGVTSAFSDSLPGLMCNAGASSEKYEDGPRGRQAGGGGGDSVSQVPPH